MEDIREAQADRTKIAKILVKSLYQRKQAQVINIPLEGKILGILQPPQPNRYKYLLDANNFNIRKVIK